MATAQHLFDSKDCILNPLNTSAELDKYIVEDVNSNNSTVHFMHGKPIQEVSITTTFFYDLFISPISVIQQAQERGEINEPVVETTGRDSGTADY